MPQRTPQITAATRAGDGPNQDVYAYGDSWAFVLDGASSFGPDQSAHDGGWYARRLRDALCARLSTGHSDLEQVVASSIEEAASAHGDPTTCPTSTIALARWDDEQVDLYVLGDSTIVIIDHHDQEILTDSRMEEVGTYFREEYRKRLRRGGGFDDGHRTLLQNLQREEHKQRNQPGEYWIAGADPQAASHGMRRSLRRDQVDALILLTDGAAAAHEYAGPDASWFFYLPQDSESQSERLDEVLETAHRIEAEDPSGERWPRSKIHDDKTICTIGFINTSALSYSYAHRNQKYPYRLSVTAFVSSVISAITFISLHVLKSLSVKDPAILVPIGSASVITGSIFLLYALTVVGWAICYARSWSGYQAWARKSQEHNSQGFLEKYARGMVVIYKDSIILGLGAIIGWYVNTIKKENEIGDAAGRMSLVLFPLLLAGYTLFKIIEYIYTVCRATLLRDLPDRSRRSADLYDNTKFFFLVSTSSFFLVALSIRSLAEIIFP